MKMTTKKGEERDNGKEEDEGVKKGELYAQKADEEA